MTVLSADLLIKDITRQGKSQVIYKYEKENDAIHSHVTEKKSFSHDDLHASAV